MSGDGGGRAAHRRVLFADLVGFTPLSERLDAEDVAAVQDAYFAAVRETVTRHGGQLEKFIGDAAMAASGSTVHGTTTRSGPSGPGWRSSVRSSGWAASSGSGG